MPQFPEEGSRATEARSQDLLQHVTSRSPPAESEVRSFMSMADGALQPVDTGPVLTVDGFEIRPSELQVFVHGERVGFTVREFQVFFALASRLDRVVTRADLYRLVWGQEIPRRDRSVDVFVRKVRRKLAELSPGWTYIHTHFGIGYRFSPERDG